jgi:hypothetical protein
MALALLIAGTVVNKGGFQSAKTAKTVMQSAATEALGLETNFTYCTDIRHR